MNNKRKYRTIMLLLSFMVLFFFITACKKNTNVDTQNALFESLSTSKTGINFQNILTEDDKFNIIEYLYYYNGAGVATGDINNDGLPDIYFSSNRGKNQLFLNKGNLHFEDITEQAGVGGSGDWKTGVSMVDVNGDGWLDIYVCEVATYKGLQGKNQLFINNKNNTFSEKAADFGLDFQCLSQQAVFFDYDKDGDLDCFLACSSVHSQQKTRDSTLRNERDAIAGDKFLKNENNKFVDISEKAGIFGSKIGFSLGVAISDINGDGWQDIYVTNDFYENDYLYYNTGKGSFREGIAQSVGHTSNFSMGVDIADFNNDALPDIITLDMKPNDEVRYKSAVGADAYDIFQFKKEKGFHYQYPRNNLQLNRGKNEQKNAVFSEIGQFAGISATDWSWSSLFVDLDNDGWKDIHITNGIIRRPDNLDYLKFISNQNIQNKAQDKALLQQMPLNPAPNFAYRNKGGFTFEDVSQQWNLNQNGFSCGTAYADLDNDGDLDLVINNINAPAAIMVNKSNDISKYNFLKIKTLGNGLNPFGVGAKVMLWANGQLQMQEENPTRGWLSSSDYLLHFGLGNATIVDSLKIIWNSGTIQLLKQIPINQQITLYEKNSIIIKNNIKNIAKLPFQKIENLNFKHNENQFIDMTRERLMPYLLSTQGPKIAVGDVNNDKIDDFYVCGASGQGGKLCINNVFKSISDSKNEEVNAIFFDADGDKDLDLYVVSGGNEYPSSAPENQDKLYLNDGKGNFSLSLNSLPIFEDSGSAVSACDFDNDGDIDLFVGRRAVVGAYGLSPKSYLLQNDGKGHFSDITDIFSPDLRRIGMVTAAIWQDVNGDKKQDLIVVGEWFSPTVFYNEGTKLRSQILIDKSGLYQGIVSADFDKDGDMDFMISNFGKNSYLQIADNQAINIWIKDFDNNATLDPILTYYRQGKDCPLATKDEIASQMPFMRKRYLDYKKYAESSFQDIFTKEQLKDAIHKKLNTLASLYIENKGNGNFESYDLPDEAQFSTIFAIYVDDFNKDGNLDAMVGGNFYEVQPSVGRMDANAASLLLGDGKGHFINQNLPMISGQLRDIKSIISKTGQKKILLARNNDNILLLTN